MQLTEYAAREGIGVYSRLSRESGVCLKTVLKAARDGLKVTAETAEKLAPATGGACTVDEIRNPRPTKAKPPRRGEKKRRKPPRVAA